MTDKPTYSRSIEDEQFFKQLRTTVKEKVDKNEKNYANLIKTLLLPSLYVVFWVLAMNFRTSPLFYYVFFTLMGITMILIFVNLIHEACHYTLFKTRWKNEVVYCFFDIMGANSFIWANRHIRMHHNYSNTIGFDSDIEQGGMLKVFPSDKGGIIQKYQHYWFILLYPLFLMNWLLIRDFKDFYSPKSYIRKFVIIPPKEHFKLWFFKLCFFTYILIIPIIFFKVEISQALIGFLFQVICGGIFGLFVLLPPHANVGNDFPEPNDNLILPTSWLRHQFDTTNDVDGRNFISKYVMNNYNYHLAHHIFPNIGAIHADELTDIIHDFAKKNNFTYKSYPLLTSLKMHYLLLKKNAISPKSFFEDPM